MKSKAIPIVQGFRCVLGVLTAVGMVVAFASMSVFLSAEERKTDVLPDVVVTTKFKESQGEAFYVRVLDKEALRRIPGRDLSSVLGHVLHLRPSAHSANRYVQAAGMENSYTKILLNGVPVTGSVGEGFPLDNIDLQSVERIEIMRGANSVLYGSEAVMGVINIITHASDDSEGKVDRGGASFELDQRYGFQGEYTGALGVKGHVQAFSWDVKGGFLSDNGFAPLSNIGGVMKKHYQLPERQKWNATGRLDYSAKGSALHLQGSASVLESLVASDLANRLSNQQQRQRLSLGWRQRNLLGMNVEGYSAFKHFRHSSREMSVFSKATETEKENNSPQDFKDLENELRLLGRWGRHSALLGANLLTESLASADLSGEALRRNAFSLFAQERMALGPLVGGRQMASLAVGLRTSTFWDANQTGNGLVFSPNGAFNLRPHKTTTFRLSYGYAYKAPSFKQNYFNFVHPGSINFLVRGNPNLKPERAHSYQASVLFEPHSLANLNLEAHFHDIQNLMGYSEFEVGSGFGPEGNPYNGIVSYHNHEQARRLEASASLEGKWQHHFRYSLGYAYLHGENTIDGVFEPATLIVPHRVKANLGVQVPYLKTEVNAFFVWYGKELISYQDKLYSEPHYNIDMSFRQKTWEERLVLAMELRNVLNTVSEAYDQPEGMTVALGVRLMVDATGDRRQ